MFAVFSIIFSECHPTTMTRWLLSTKEWSSLNTEACKAHSCRSSFSSRLVRRGLSLAEVMARDNWSPNSRTFKRFCNRAYAATIVTSLVILFIYSWEKINILISHK